jgi:hypothetical protein
MGPYNTLLTSLPLLQSAVRSRADGRGGGSP